MRREEEREEMKWSVGHRQRMAHLGKRAAQLESEGSLYAPDLASLAGGEDGRLLHFCSSLVCPPGGGANGERNTRGTVGA